jgi:hypothetical protein
VHDAFESKHARVAARLRCDSWGMRVRKDLPGC